MLAEAHIICCFNFANIVVDFSTAQFFNPNYHLVRDILYISAYFALKKILYMFYYSVVKCTVFECRRVLPISAL